MRSPKRGAGRRTRIRISLSFGRGRYIKRAAPDMAFAENVSNVLISLAMSTTGLWDIERISSIMEAATWPELCLAAVR